MKNKKYIVYEMNTNKNICMTDEFKHAFDLRVLFNDNPENKRYSIRVITED